VVISAILVLTLLNVEAGNMPTDILLVQMHGYEAVFKDFNALKKAFGDASKYEVKDSCVLISHPANPDKTLTAKRIPVQE